MKDDPNFLNNFHRFVGKPTQHAPFAPGDRERLTGRLPEALIRLFEVDGWSSFKSQSLWLCDPDVMRNVKQSWLGDFPKAEIFLRTALGDFYFWDGKYVRACLVHLSSIMYASNNVTWFLSDVITEPRLFKSLGLPKFANLGRKAHGPLEPDEVYFWKPALALGGSSDTSALEKGKLDVTLDILSQLQEINVQDVGRR